MKRTVSWLAKLFVSSVVAVALVITLGIQQAQAQDTGYCCTGSNTSLKLGESCIVEYTPDYQFSVAYIGNPSKDIPALVTVDDIYNDYSDEELFIDPHSAEAIGLSHYLPEIFTLVDGEVVNFVCTQRS